MMKRLCCFLVIVTAFANTPAASGQDGGSAPGSSTKLEGEFFQAVERMKSLADSLVVHARVDRKYEVQGGDSPGKGESSNEIACRGNSLLLRKEAVTEGEEVVNRIAARNELYIFAVDVSSNDTELDYLEPFGQAREDRIDIDAMVNDLGIRFAICPYYYDLVPLWDFVKQPGFDITNISELDESLVRIEHSVPPKANGPVVSDAYLVCDTSKSWAVVEYGHTNKYPAQGITDKYKYEVQDLSMRGDLALINRLTTRVTRQDGSYSHFAEYRSTLLGEDPQKEIFYLSHYGVPEPSFSNLSRWAMPLLLAVLLLCLLGGLLMVWRLRTSRRAI